MKRYGWPLTAMLAFALLLLAVVIIVTRDVPLYCQRCEIGVIQVEEGVRPERRLYCVLNGREIDCAKVPGQCPDCGK